MVLWPIHIVKIRISAWITFMALRLMGALFANTLNKVGISFSSDALRDLKAIFSFLCSMSLISSSLHSAIFLILVV